MGEAETRRLLNEILGRMGQPEAGHTLQETLAAIHGHIGGPGGANVRDMLHGIQDRQQGQSTRALMPDYFYGYSTEDPRQFADKFEIYVHLQNIPADRQLDAVRMLLKGPAEVWWSSLADADKANWAAFRVAFLNAFAGDGEQWMLEQQLEDRKQGKDELVEFYINDVIKLAKRLNKDDNDIRQVLIRGLQPGIKSYVIGQNPQGLAQTVEKIKLGETALNMSKTSETTLGSISLSTLIEGIRNVLQNEEENTKSGVASCSAGPGDEGTDVSKRHLQRHRDTNYMTQRRPRCFFCNRPGHFKRDCRVFLSQMRQVCHNCGWRGHGAWNCQFQTPDDMEYMESNQFAPDADTDGGHLQ